MNASKTTDIRWIQRFENFKSALIQLDNAVILSNQRELSELEKQGVIQAFEYNFELAWNVLKDFYEHQGEMNIQGSRDAFRTAYNRGLITDGEIWMDMIKKRQLTLHTYNKAVTEDILATIINVYYQHFTLLKQVLTNQLHHD